MTIENVVVAVGNILYAKQRLQEDVHARAKELFQSTGLPFHVSSTSGAHKKSPPEKKPPGGGILKLGGGILDHRGGGIFGCHYEMVFGEIENHS